MKINTISTINLPARLQQLPQPPIKLNCMGAELSTILKKPVLGIVGSRNVSAYGRTVTADLAENVARRGVVIVSGLALGVDSIAHQAAIEAHGLTIAVLPSGLQSIYPANHRNLASQVLGADGLLVSEYESAARPHQGSFIERNRIIAGLSDVLLVTEAAERSGSLHTARFALEQGKAVLAVPGNITSPTSAGTNNLIKMGAVPVTSPEDIYEALGISADTKNDQYVYYAENEYEESILVLLRKGLQNGHDLLAQCELPIEQFQQHLTMLEIKGAIHPLGNNHWKLK